MTTYYTLDNRKLTFRGCMAIVEGMAEECCEADTCDNSGRDIEIVTAAELIPYIRAETAYKDGETVAYADAGIIEQQLAFTLTDFTKRAGILERTMKMPIQAGVRDYYIKPPPGETISLVRSVCVAGVCLDGFQSGACCANNKCRPMRGGFVFEPQDKIVLDQATCNECGDIVVQYETFVSNTACTVDKIVIDRFQEAIVQGAAGRIRNMAGFAFTLPNKAASLKAEYDRAVNQAKIDATRGYLGRSPSVTNYQNEWTSYNAGGY